ncbi:MAG: M20 family peptidase [Chloroflexi bacterium]|nr:M20 family peptidase [Chloroflexota bacterium]
MTTSDSVTQHIDRSRIVEMLTTLIRFNSVNPPGNETPVAEYLGGSLRQAGLQVELVSLAENRANVMARLPGQGKAPGLMFCGHTDTVHPGEVAWSHNPFGAETVNGRMFGRGTADMKGGVAAMVVAVEALARAGIPLAGDVIIAGTAGEEVDCLGASHLLQSGGMEGVGALVIPEPTDLALVTAHRGALWLKLITQGKAAHGSMPELGVNAILHMYKLLQVLLQHQFGYQPHPLLRLPTVNVGTIQGGTKTNVVADMCQAMVDIRTVPGMATAEVVREIQELINHLKVDIPDFKARIEIVNDKPAITTDPQVPLIQAAQRTGQMILGRGLTPQGASYFTDASVLTPPTGVPTLIFGPGEAGMAHQPEEFVDIDKVIQAAHFYAALVLEMLGS